MLVITVFDAANWLMDEASQTEDLTTLKLHSLLYFAQGYFAVASGGVKMMPATFIATKKGAVEPNLLRVFEAPGQGLRYEDLPKRGEAFLRSIWRKFGGFDEKYLVDMIKTHAPYKNAMERGNGSEILIQDMQVFYSVRRETAVVSDNKVDKVLTPRIMRSQTGRPVNVTTWQPRKLKNAGPGGSGNDE